MSAACRACAAPIVWARTTNGKLIPLDATPVPGGNIDLQGTRAIVLGPLDLLDGQPRHTAHFATCPDADDFRRPR